MNSTPTPKAIEPDNTLIAPADEGVARAYEQIARADEQLARVSEQLAKMERDAARPPPAAPGPRSPPGRSGLRALVGLSLAACIVVAALLLQSSYGSSAKLVVARWMPLLVSTSSLPESPPSPAQPAPSIVQVASAEAAPPQATPLAQTASQEAAPTAIAALPDPAQLLQTIARDLANVERDIEQVRANQQQTATDTSKAIEQLRAGQEEIKRVLARVSEQNPPKTSAAAPPPPSTLRKIERMVQSPPARVRPRIPREWIYEDW